MGIDVAPETGQRHRPHATLDLYFVPRLCALDMSARTRRKKKEPMRREEKKRRTPWAPELQITYVYIDLCVAHIIHASATRTYTHREVH